MQLFGFGGSNILLEGGSMSRLPILELECSKEGHLEGGSTPNRTETWLFEGVKVDEIG